MSRIQKFLPRLIDNDQTGFPKTDSLAKIYDLSLFIDFERAFDSLEWSFIEKTLNYYNFGSSLVAWIRLFYTNLAAVFKTRDGPLTFSL